jgi:predicted metalloprotease with PDZ domain
VNAQVLYYAQSGYDNWRRATDYYDEGILLWLDVDTTIREKSGGKKSLNDFIAAFHGLGGNTAPKVVPYTFQDLVTALNAVQPYDWTAFLNQRLHSNGPGAPLDGIARAGYRLTYTPKPTEWTTLVESSGSANLWFSIGLIVGKDGGIVDVLKGSPADKAGLGPGMKIFAVDGRRYAGPLLHTAVADAKTGTPLELIVENMGFYSTVKIDYRGGELYPALERTSGADLLGPIIAPMVK